MSTHHDFTEMSLPPQRRRITDIVPATAELAGFDQWHDLSSFADPNEESIALQETPFEARIAGAHTEALLIEPLDKELSKGKPAIVIDPGYLAPRSAYHDYGRFLSRGGNPVAIFAVPIGQSIRKALHPTNLKDAIRLHSQSTLAVTRGVLEKHGGQPDERLHYVGHSLGDIVMSKFIDRYPEHVRSAISIGGAGNAKHSFGQMAVRGALAIPREIIPYVKAMSAENRKLFGQESSPALLHFVRKAREGYHAATIDKRSSVAQARASGIPHGAMWLSNDTFFPPSEVTQDVKDLYDVSLMLHGNHLMLQNQPSEAARATRWLLHQLEICQLPQTNPQTDRHLAVVETV